jgi:hypothetical protein
MHRQGTVCLDQYTTKLVECSGGNDDMSSDFRGLLPVPSIVDEEDDGKEHNNTAHDRYDYHQHSC